MKRVIFMVVFLICSILIFNNYFSNISGFVTLKYGESKVEQGHVITIEKITENYVTINVDGISGYVKLNGKEEINGIEITANEIFYVSEAEHRSVDLSIGVTSRAKTICNNKICEGGENSENCCIDCGCEKGYKCKEGICKKILDECRDNKDCDDSNENTIDLCIGDPKKCVNKIPVQCTQNEECDDNNECTKDECKNKECFNTKITDCKQREGGVERGLEGDGEKRGFLSNLINGLLNILGL